MFHKTAVPRLIFVFVVGLTLGLSGCQAADSTGQAADSASLTNAESTENTGKSPGVAATASAQDDGAYSPPGQTSDPKKGWFYDLSYRDVILSPNGHWLLAMVPLPGPDAGFATPGFALVVHDLTATENHLLTQYRDLRQVAFSQEGNTAYLLAADGQSVTELDLPTRQPKATHALQFEYASLQLVTGGAVLIASNQPTTPEQRAVAAQTPADCVALDGRNVCRVAAIDLKTGKRSDRVLTAPLLDVAEAPGAIVLAHRAPKVSDSELSSIAIAIRVRGDLTDLFPDRSAKGWAHSTACATELAIVAKGQRVLWTGNGCATPTIELRDVQKDVLVFKLGTLGDVVRSKNGAIAAFALPTPAFGRDPTQPPTNVSVAVLDVHTAKMQWTGWSSHPQPPRLVISPNGKHLYARSASADGVDVKFAAIRTDNLSQKPVIGGAQQLDRATWSQGGKLLYVLSNGAVYRISTGMSVATHVDVPGSPELMDVTDAGDLLVLGEATAPQFYVVDLVASDKVVSLHLSAL